MKDLQKSSSDNSEKRQNIMNSPKKSYKTNSHLSFSDDSDSGDVQEEISNIFFNNDKDMKEKKDDMNSSESDNTEKYVIDKGSQTMESSFNKSSEIKSSESSDSETENYLDSNRKSKVEKNEELHPKKMKIKSAGKIHVIPRPEESDDDDFYYSLKDNEMKKISNEDTMFLRRMIIKLDHKVPPQHEVESRCGGMTPKPNERKEFETYVKMKRGSFDPEEDQLIMRNWKAFCELNGWNKRIVLPFLKWRHNGAYYIPCIKERKKFIQFLARDLNNRSLYSVFHRFKVLNSDNKSSRYSKEEDDYILDYMNKHPTVLDRLSRIGVKLNRSRHSIWRRYRVLKANSEKSP